jgi:hypothetical protein
MKKKIFSYVTVCSTLVAFFSLGNYYCYQSALKHFNQMQEDYESRLGEQVQVYVSNEMEDKMEEWETEALESVEAGSVENVLSEDSVFQVQSYDSLTDTTVTEYEQLPEQLVGCDRQGAQEYCSNYVDKMSAEEFLNGLQSVSLVSFSSDRLSIRKNYDVSKIEYRYYIISDGEQVVVYYGDMKNVYERTGIAVSTLSKAERKALKKGIQVKDEEELYGILENFSS